METRSACLVKAQPGRPACSTKRLGRCNSPYALSGVHHASAYLPRAVHVGDMQQRQVQIIPKGCSVIVRPETRAQIPLCWARHMRVRAQHLQHGSCENNLKSTTNLSSWLLIASVTPSHGASPKRATPPAAPHCSRLACCPQRRSTLTEVAAQVAGDPLHVLRDKESAQLGTSQVKPAHPRRRASGQQSAGAAAGCVRTGSRCIAAHKAAGRGSSNSQELRCGGCWQGQAPWS